VLTLWIKCYKISNRGVVIFKGKKVKVKKVKPWACF